MTGPSFSRPDCLFDGGDFEKMVTPGRQVEIETARLQLVAGTFVVRRAEQVGKPHFLARQKIELNRDMTLALRSGIVYDYQRTALCVIVPGETDEVVPGRISLPGRTRLPQMEHAVVHFRPP